LSLNIWAFLPYEHVGNSADGGEEKGLTDFPDGWFGHISSEELEIDEIVKVW
jgi:hypothetical protein